MNGWKKGLLALLVTVAFAGTAFAQGGGASSTGTIQGRVADAQGAILPGVTVTATSPSALGAQTAVTSETGNYRCPALPPGVYELTFELSGFNGLKRSGISISLGFTANVNVELALATLQETVTVSGSSPSPSHPAGPRPAHPPRDPGSYPCCWRRRPGRMRTH